MIDQQSLLVAVQRFQAVAGVIDASIVSHDGWIMTSTSSDEDLTDIIGAMSSEVIAKGKQTVNELELGSLWGNALFGTEGAVLTRVVNEEMLLLVRVAPSASLAAIFDQMDKVVRSLALD